MAGFGEVVDQFQKDYGENVGGKGYTLPDVERIQTGIFEFDLATGGGVPQCRTIEVYGPESSGKTNLVYKIIAAKQRMDPDKENAYFDLENTFVPEWAARMGVDVDRLYVFRPDYAEQVVDMVEALLHADECGVVAIDSLAAMVTTRELNQSAEKSDVGGAGLVMGKLVRKSTRAISDAESDDRKPTLVLVNQTRSKIGVMFGSPETTPGGAAPKFAAGMRIRTYGKNIVDTSISKTLPVRKHMSVVIIKWKVPIVCTNCEFEMVMVPHKGLNVGQVDDWNTLSKYMRDYGHLEKAETGSGWVMLNHQYKTLAECRQALLSKPEAGNAVRQEIIRLEVEKAHSLDINTGEEDGTDGGQV